MNKRDFYKELMSEYMFDKEKILVNAKKGRMAGHKSLPLYIGMTAAAAAIITVSGVSIAMNIGNDNGVVLNPNSGITILELTPEQRIEKALEELQKNQNSQEMRDVLVTFKGSLAPPQAQGIMAAQSSVQVKMLIMEDDSKITDIDAIAAVFNGGSAKIRGAVIGCTGDVMNRIFESEFVELVEVLSTEDLANLMAIEPVETPTVPVNPDNTSSDINNSGVGGDVPNTPVVGVDDLPNIPDTESGNSTVEPSGDNNSEPSGSDNPVQPNNPNGSDVSDLPINPEPSVDVTKLPEGVTLPTAAAEKFSYITDDIGAERAYFLTEDIFFVSTKNALRLYRWNGETETLVAEQAAADVKVCWISENGARLMVTATEGGARTKMYIVDAVNCTINDMQIENAVYGGEIVGAAYNENLDVLAVNVSWNGGNEIYVANLSGYQAANVTLVASGLSEGAALLAASNGAVYFSNIVASSGTAGTTVYKYANGAVVETLRLEGVNVMISNSAFTHAIAVGSSGSFVFDPATEKMIAVDSDKTISFGVSSHSLACNGGYYSVVGGQLVADGSLSTIAKIDFMRSFSTKYAAVASNGSVRIFPSTYTGRVTSLGVTFTQPTESASTQEREAVNSAIGLINAIADGKVESSGIDTAQKLSQTIDACFTAAAAAQLKEKCGITDGSLSYNTSALGSISVADTVLVMQNAENGTLYVKAGVFDGRTGYYTVPVKLAVENGALKADCIIN